VAEYTPPETVAACTALAIAGDAGGDRRTGSAAVPAQRAPRPPGQPAPAPRLQPVRGPPLHLRADGWSPPASARRRSRLRGSSTRKQRRRAPGGVRLLPLPCRLRRARGFPRPGCRRTRRWSGGRNRGRASSPHRPCTARSADGRGRRRAHGSRLAPVAAQIHRPSSRRLNHDGRAVRPAQICPCAARCRRRQPPPTALHCTGQIRRRLSGGCGLRCRQRTAVADTAPGKWATMHPARAWWWLCCRALRMRLMTLRTWMNDS